MDGSFTFADSKSRVTIAKALVDNKIARFRVALELHSDQGCNFESKVFGEMANCW